MSAADAIAEPGAKSGTQFDPQVVEALLERLAGAHLGGRGDVISVAV